MPTTPTRGRWSRRYAPDWVWTRTPSPRTRGPATRRRSWPNASAGSKLGGEHELDDSRRYDTADRQEQPPGGGPHHDELRRWQHVRERCRGGPGDRWRHRAVVGQRLWR